MATVAELKLKVLVDGGELENLDIFLKAFFKTAQEEAKKSQQSFASFLNVFGEFGAVLSTRAFNDFKSAFSLIPPYNPAY